MKTFLQKPLGAFVVMGCVLSFVSGALSFLLFLMYFTDTTYADGFSRNEFNKIEIGMPAENVVDKIGPPLEIKGKHKGQIERFAWTNDVLQKEPYKSAGLFELHYSKAYDSRSNYRCYVVGIQNGIVISKQFFIYYD